MQRLALAGYNPAVSIVSPFPEIDLPSLHVWLQRSWALTVGDDVPTDLADWMKWQLERMESLSTWGVYRDGELGGYIEAQECRGTDPLPEQCATITAVFRKDLWGLANTQTALRLALYELFNDGMEMAVFPVLYGNQPIEALCESIGAISIGTIQTPMLVRSERLTRLYVLTASEWEQQNTAFLAEYVEATT